MSNLAKSKRKIVAVLSALLVTICFNSNTPFISKGNEQHDFNQMANDVVVLVNEAREAAGLNPLYIVPYLCDSANVRARECITRFSHYRPSYDYELDKFTDSKLEEIDEKYNTLIAEAGGDAERVKQLKSERNDEKAALPKESMVRFFTVLDSNLVPFTGAAENIAGGTFTDTAEKVFQQWKNSPGHWSNIMSPEYTHIGVGVSFEENSTYRYYWEQIFVKTDKELDGQSIPKRNPTVPISAGDINGDAEINTFDLISLERELESDKKTFNALQKDSADMFKDGVITSADVAVLRKYLLGDYKSLPVTMEDMFSK